MKLDVRMWYRSGMKPIHFGPDNLSILLKVIRPILGTDIHECGKFGAYLNKYQNLLNLMVVS